MNSPDTLSRTKVWRNLAITSLVVLFLFSLHLAINRIFQVDEAQNVYMSRVVAMGETHRYFTNGSLFLLGPLSWIARHSTTSVAIYTWDRLLFLGVFWANILLLALSTGAAIRSRALVYSLLAAATLAPLWDYGFEIRHDNVVLLLLLSTWWILRRSSLRALPAYFCIGLLSGLMQFVAFKGFLYWVPISFIALAAPPPQHGTSPRWRLALAWGAGLIIAGALAFLAYKATGTWDSFLNGFRTSLGHSENPERFAPWISLDRLPTQIPLLTGMATAMVLSVGLSVSRSGKAALTWDGPLPEAALALGTFLALIANPVPYPYNLVLVVPFLFLSAAAWVPEVAGHLRGNVPMVILAGGIVAFGQAIPFWIQTSRHLDMPNSRQEQLMSLAESMTDPKTDPVYDAAGLVPTRESIHFQWFLHSLVMPKIASGQLPTVRSMLAARPPTVIMPNYRLDWLGEEDRDYIAQHYLPLADDFFVLGASFPEGGGSFQCIHPGRYSIVQPASADAGTGAAIKVDGMNVGPNRVVRLDIGPHQVSTPSGVKVALVWVGPVLSQATLPAPANHRDLFVNWY